MITKHLRLSIDFHITIARHNTTPNWQDMIMGGEIAFQNILAPVVATLSEEDQKFFNEGIRFDLFEEFIDMFQKSFIVKEDPPVIVELGGEA